MHDRSAAEHGPVEPGSQGFLSVLRRTYFPSGTQLLGTARKFREIAYQRSALALFFARLFEHIPQRHVEEVDGAAGH